MALSNALGQAGHAPESLQVTAAVTFQPGEGITGSHLLVSAKVPGISEEDFQRLAEEAKANCPVSKALAGIPITLEAALAQNGTPPESIDTTASVTFTPGTGITGSHLNVNAVVPGLDPETFDRLAADAKANCPVSKALAGIEITLEATLA
jgi:organic hydroperoxide reductase OsmC/OhrA